MQKMKFLILLLCYAHQVTFINCEIASSYRQRYRRIGNPFGDPYSESKRESRCELLIRSRLYHISRDMTSYYSRS